MKQYQINVARRNGETFDNKPRYVFWFRTDWNENLDDVKAQVAAFRANLGDVNVEVSCRENVRTILAI